MHLHLHRRPRLSLLSLWCIDIYISIAYCADQYCFNCLMFFYIVPRVGSIEYRELALVFIIVAGNICVFPLIKIKHGAQVRGQAGAGATRWLIS